MPTDWIPQNMNDAAMWSLIVGFFLPIIVNFIVNATWSPAVKSLVAFAAAVVVGVITAVVTGAYAGLGIPSAILLTLVVAITSYQNFWKQVAPTMQRGAAVKLEQKASGSYGLPDAPTGDGR